MPVKKHAIVVLPGVRNIADFSQVLPRHRRWLARSKVSRAAPGEILSQVLGILGAPAPPEGFGALRLRAQTGIVPEGWVAAADPVFLEARLNHVVLHTFDEGELSDEEVAGAFAHLQENLGGGEADFSSVGKFGYVHRRHPMEVARASPAVAQGDFPESFMPAGEQAAAHDRLQSEIQMCLYDSPTNRRRATAGRPPVTSLWMWGGGSVPALPEMPLPPLYADDPLFRGYWLAASAAAAEWTGALESCLARSPEGFVAVVPGSADGEGGDAIDTHLAILRRMLRRGRLQTVTLLDGHGSRVDIDRWAYLRLWRRTFTLPGKNNGG